MPEKKPRILLIYPALYKMTGLPAGLASISALLKKNGYEVKIFDTAFYANRENKSQTKIRSERGISKEVRDEDRYAPDNDTDMGEDIVSFIKGYQPDIIGVSILEVVYDVSLELTRLIRRHFRGIPIIAGGIFPTFSPEKVLGEESIDVVCIGEGETAMLELCDRLAKNQGFLDIRGLWVKKNGRVYKNKPARIQDINKLPYPDYTEFDQRLFYKPMQGRMFKMVNIVTSRGCFYNCTFCAAPGLAALFKERGCGRYYRQMGMAKVLEQIQLQIDRYNPEFLYFSSVNFLAISEEEFDIFIKGYRKLGLPFWIQTRPETITKRRLAELKKAGMYWLSIGLEHGNEEFRKRVLRRGYPNELFFEKMEILKDLGIGASINNVIGFPSETRELIFDTINANRQLLERNPKLECNVFLFIPFKGCELYDVCIKNGLLNLDFINVSDFSEKSVLNFSEDFQRDLKGLIRTFNLYARLPEKYYVDIRVAERDDEEGNIMLRRLSSLLKDKFYH